MKTYQVYVLTSPDGRCYVGMTSQTLHNRLLRGYKDCPSMRAAVERFGIKSFSAKIVRDNLTRDEAELLEQTMIRTLDSTNPSKGLNMTHGGIRFKHNEVSKKRISVSSTPRSEEFRQKKYSEQEPYKHGVRQFDTNGKFIRQFSSIREAAKATHSDPSNIRKCANGTLKTTNHYKWSYI